MTGSSGGRRERPRKTISAWSTADHVVEHDEIDVAGLAFGPAQSVGSVVGEADALQDHAEPHDGLFDRSAAVGRELFPVIAQRPLQNRPLIGDLARDDAANDFLRRVGDAILLAPEENVAADRPLDSGLETSGPIEQDDRDPGARAGLDQRRRYIDRAEDDDGARACEAARASARRRRLRRPDSRRPCAGSRLRW